MKKAKLFLVALLFITVAVQAQNQNSDSLPYTNFPKHEIGFSWGAMPILGLLGAYSPFSHIGHDNGDNGNYDNMYHLGSFTFNYQYYFSRKHSIGASVSWLGRHLDRHWIYSYGPPNSSDYGSNWFRHIGDTVNGKGWNHYFTVQGNYRFTYYHKKIVSLYFAIHTGATLCIRDKAIPFIETQYFLFGRESNEQYLCFFAFHLTGLGIELGRSNNFNLELGIGTQGVLKIGYKYKF